MSATIIAQINDDFKTAHKLFCHWYNYMYLGELKREMFDRAVQRIVTNMLSLPSDVRVHADVEGSRFHLVSPIQTQDYIGFRYKLETGYNKWVHEDLFVGMTAVPPVRPE